MSSQYVFEAIGTKWVIDIWDTINSVQEENVLKQIHERIDIFDKTYSRFRSDSLVTKMSEKEGRYVLPDDAKLMMDIYYDLFSLTEGLLTPLIGQVIVDSGYDAKYSLVQNRELTSPLDWNDILEYSHPYLIVKKPVLLDFGAGGKGYLIDLVGEVLKKNNINNFCIDAGGDILHKHSGDVSLKIGLENPENFTEVIGLCNLSNKSLCASAGSRRKWGKFHHIINPKTLASPEDILATLVLADTTLIADALATSLFFVFPKKFIPHYDFEYVILYADHSVIKSDGFFQIF